MIKYGLISEIDGRTLEKTIDLICEDFGNEISVTEIGLFDCGTANGIRDYILSKSYWVDNIKNGHKFGGGVQMICNYIGVDCEKDKLIHPPQWMKFIRGNSNEVYNQIPDNSQHLIVQDANHSYPNVIQDFFCYMRKVKRGGYMWWHDVAVHVQGKDWQRMGDKADSDMSISVRKALTDIGLFDNKFEGWEFVMEDADLNDAGGGCAVFRRI